MNTNIQDGFSFNTSYTQSNTNQSQSKPPNPVIAHYGMLVHSIFQQPTNHEVNFKKLIEDFDFIDLQSMQTNSDNIEGAEALSTKIAFQMLDALDQCKGKEKTQLISVLEEELTHSHSHKETNELIHYLIEGLKWDLKIVSAPGHKPMPTAQETDDAPQAHERLRFKNLEYLEHYAKGQTASELMNRAIDEKQPALALYFAMKGSTDAKTAKTLSPIEQLTARFAKELDPEKKS